MTGSAERPATILDVASLARTSKTTASRALNGEAGVAESTRRRVQEAAERLGYRGNPAARTLRTRQSGLVGFVAPQLNEVYSDQAEQLSMELRRLNFGLMLASSGWSTKEELAIIEEMIGRGVDALVLSLTDDRNPELTPLLRSCPCPVLLLDREVHGVEADHVLSDPTTGVRKAVSQLADFGHTRIGLIVLPLTIRVGRRIHEGWRLGMTECGLEPDEELVHSIGHFDREAGARGADRLLDGGATALVVGTTMAPVMGTSRAIRDRGLSVPRDVSVVGYEEYENAALRQPRLSTITYPTGDLGISACKVLLDRLADPARPPEVRTVPTDFLPGTSTGPVPGARRTGSSS